MRPKNAADQRWYSRIRYRNPWAHLHYTKRSAVQVSASIRGKCNLSVNQNAARSLRQLADQAPDPPVRLVIELLRLGEHQDALAVHLADAVLLAELDRRL